MSDHLAPPSLHRFGLTHARTNVQSGQRLALTPNLLATLFGEELLRQLTGQPLPAQRGTTP